MNVRITSPSFVDPTDFGALYISRSCTTALLYALGTATIWKDLSSRGEKVTPNSLEAGKYTSLRRTKVCGDPAWAFRNHKVGSLNLSGLG